MEAVVVDTNLLLLLIVGSTDRRLIAAHKRLAHFDTDDFDTLTRIISLHSNIVVVPHVMAEVANLARQIGEPARGRVQTMLARFITSVAEVPVTSQDGVRRSEFQRLGLTDAALLHLCTLEGYTACALLTADQELAVRAEMLGCAVWNFNAYHHAA